ncbi:MAG TPA: hypothetical protein VGG27_04810 [Magnetospirillaceae bacterium]
MATFFTHLEWHIGDNLWHLQFLRGLAKRYPEHHFVHAMQYSYLPQMIEVVCDISNITLIALEHRPAESINVWLSHDGYHGKHPNRFDIVAVLIDFFRDLSGMMGLESPIHTSSDLLFDYPAIQRIRNSDFDFLVVNSLPRSGQFRGYDTAGFDDLIGRLIARGYSVVTTSPSTHNVPCTHTSGYSISAVGGVSLNCKCIVGVPNGPMWPTFNVWNRDTLRLRVLLLDNGDKVLLSPNTIHVDSIAQSIQILTEGELLPV